MKKLLLLITLITSLNSFSFGRPKEERTPFTNLYFKKGNVMVEVRSKTYRLNKIDNIDIYEILEFCKNEYNKNCEKRMAEDLSFLFFEMGRNLPGEVELELSNSIGVREYLKKVKATKENRHIIYRKRLNK